MSARPTAFVLLAHGFGATSWNSRFHAGKIIGLNEEYAYGYHHAEKEGVHVRYSEDVPEGRFSKLVRFAVRGLIGFDLVHAWRNRAAFFAADVVWTHTENMSLAAALLCRLFPKKTPPKLILQSVWLCDNWTQMSSVRRRLYKALLSQADVLTFLSPLNTAQARTIFPNKRCEFIRFGIPSSRTNPPRAPRGQRPLRLLSLGNDRHRDWTTLVEAVRNQTDINLVIVSGTAPKSLVSDKANCQITSPKQNSELSALFDDADIIVVPLTENLHASGITVVEEAIVKGCPLIVTDVGGLRGYVEDSDVWYVEPHDPLALRDVIRQVASDPSAALAKVVSAQEKLKLNGMSSVAYAAEHARLSRQLLGLANTQEPASRRELA
ncbi:glycosyltransferase family 4 protein [Pseudomonas turukhanskensis]|uniref:Glycosyltransferase group 1 protein n=1 Tax=Pseudomonas turukhanskensis TaxID=1806536 RepID=A0A9W6KAZ5_9PSED|nr:glycosyltransferase family 4 protein [Pseudomonas turukhanskensis]GLK91319.1 glycosyltransferase group 1 protein [Pseudomonas turukhanskensis]